ncbi:type II toxin-antitoxin system Phd/YefM family antitoxin [Planktothrix agardhii]|jgi:hypothetical protein|uniref:Antitoxin n=2 Tax=Planktothrix agardhii TaxID=1160 RepID=A0A073CAX9_PLAA1|nr:type II toxin-antitoxin system Phd/YefM family antitoxin [Planktothrix agardhii]MCF3608848.1 type II toxin-antitoxin system Phd/YefM family antitoxin [Planktothrix agardhii 1033]BBD54362.1 hypothetical protein NIES204_16530 [Planktothrix agardhii NIES-204]KEI65464.1 hypothetical protein A19Y_0226 [Planktothrix agardhii NIVA-CYA 126/8]MBG0745725.1 type II toxin-antitoxin system Phd/YefM family antitoxin [Planktothrix agardhii KL2]MCB8752712.1 type II toxin-antitoxin system Phd/YefM family an
MTNVDITEIQGNFSELLSRVEQQGEKVVIEQNDQELVTLEDVIKGYNVLYGTNFTLKNITNN